MTNSTRRAARHPVTGRAPRVAGVLLAVLLAVAGLGAWTDTAGASPRYTVHGTAVRTAHATVSRSATVTVRASAHGRTVSATATAHATGKATAKATGRASATATRTSLARARALHRAAARAEARANSAATARAAQRARALATTMARAQARTQAEQAVEKLATRQGGTSTSNGTSSSGTGGSSAGTDPGTAPGVASGSGATACGGESPVKSDGSPWACTFDDEFGGTGLDTAKWTAWNNVNYNTNATMCYYDDPSHIWVRDGYLNLAVTKLASQMQCPTPFGPKSASYGGAVVHSKDKFSQDGGMFEARIKFGGGTGLHDAFWLWPEYDKQLYPGHAEIDVAEAYGALPDTMFGNTHLNDASGPGDGGAVNACSVANWAAGFHTYAIEWTAGKQITFLFDGVKCATFANWTALPGYPNSAPFDQPFFMILQTLVDDGSFSPAPNASTAFPAVTQVDYVRVWK